MDLIESCLYELAEKIRRTPEEEEPSMNHTDSSFPIILEPPVMKDEREELSVLSGNLANSAFKKPEQKEEDTSVFKNK